MLKRQVIKNVFSYFSCMFAILKENKYGLGCKINARRWINKKSEETCKQSKTSCKLRFVGCKFTRSGFVCVISTLSVRTLVGNFQHRKKSNASSHTRGGLLRRSGSRVTSAELSTDRRS